MYDAEIALLVADLGLSPQLNIDWSFEHKEYLYKDRGEPVWGQAHGILLGKHWRIRVATDMPYSEVVDTIAHELRQVKQWEEGWITDYPMWVWSGSPFAPALSWKKRLAYGKQPHEKDARAYAADAWKRLFEGKKNPDKVTPQMVVADLFL